MQQILHHASAAVLLYFGLPSFSGETSVPGSALRLLAGKGGGLLPVFSLHRRINATLDRRCDEIKSGEVKPIKRDEVYEHLRRKSEDRRAARE